MTRNIERDMVKSGAVTPEQTRNLMIEVITKTINKVENCGAADLNEMLVGPESEEKALSQEKVLQALHSSGGIGFFSRSAHNQQVVFYWPDIFRVGFDLPKAVQTKLVWVLQAVVRRRSPLLFSFLRRKLLTEMAEISNETEERLGSFKDEDLKGVVPLDAEEVALYTNIAEQFCNMPHIGYALTRAASHMLGVSGISSKNNYGLVSKWRQGFPPNSPLLWNSFLVPRKILVQIREALLAGASIDVLDASVPEFGFGAPKCSRELFDVLALPHLAHDHGIFGVYKVRLFAGAVTHLVVNLPIVIRQLAREDRFSWIGRQYNAKSATSVESAIRDQLVVLWSARYPLVMENRVDAQRAVNQSSQSSSSVWPDAKLGDIYVIPVTAFEHYRKASRDMEMVREKRAEANPGLPVRRRPTLRLTVQLMSDPISEAGGATFTVRATHKGSEIYFCPCWEEDFDEEFLLQRNYHVVGEEVRLLDGIIRNEATREYYYTLKRYRKFDGTATRMYPQLSQWLHDHFEGMTKLQFLFMYRMLKTSPTSQALVPFNPQYKAYDSRIDFSPAEDSIIRRLLRPGQISEVMTHIEDIDPKKTRKDVVLRGTVLRNQLIAEGVFDLDSLPHANFSAGLGKRLSTLRKRSRYGETQQAPGDKDN